MIEKKDNFFHLYNKKISYIFEILENGHLGQVYFGKRVSKLWEYDICYLKKYKNKAAGTVKYSKDMGNFTLADQLQEYPVYGTSDFGMSAIDVRCESEIYYLDFQYQDYKVKRYKKRNLDFPTSYGNNAETLSIELLDVERNLKLWQNFTIFDDTAAIVKSIKLENVGEKKVNVNKCLSGVLELRNMPNHELVTLDGAWLRERHINIRPIKHGLTTVSSLKGASGHQHNPFIMIKEKDTTLETGEIYAANLIYSGNFISGVEMDEWDKARIFVGINPEYFEWGLSPKETFSTPEAVFFYSENGINSLMDETSLFVNEHVIDKKWQDVTKRPIVFNSWETMYFDFDEKKLLDAAKEVKKLGMECFVIDDGWFENRNDDRNSLGNWKYDINKFPNGLKSFSKKIHDMNLKLGIWFEPEMVSPNVELLKKHPEWLLGHPYSRKAIGRGQYVLDFSNPMVIEEIYNQIKKIIIMTNLDYIKWDMNRNITEAYSAYLHDNDRSQGEVFHRYICGVYTLYKKIISDFPDILIEGCAGGGGRYDLGILFYSPQIWPSDNSDATERLDILTGTVLGYPLSSFSSHITASPNHQTNRRTMLSTRHNIGIFGALGYELDLNKLSTQEKKEIKDVISFYKKNQELMMYGRFIKLTTNDDVYNWAVVNKDKSEAVVMIFNRKIKPNSTPKSYLKLHFLDEGKKYIINDTDIVSGEFLKKYGMENPIVFNGINQQYSVVTEDLQAICVKIREYK
ncbi:alpha-galactosidase [Ligilactobacillus sp. Marseille-Q7487]|uniref:alpha-galactosidase n=1 Tax=Ligilactobacillus sp. Marseille-Q7487 TaxID=3022128 RepID=UPI0024A84368|nr:alpha-galactosidase [Ligilactobacillus sp. Marseille-Q7487]